MKPREVMSLLDLAAPPVWGRTRRLAACRNIEDLHGAFRRSVPRAVADFVDGGAEDEVTLRRNRAAFERVRLLPHQFAGVAGVDLGIELLGDRVAMPVALAPTGIARLVHPDGELAVARAAARAGLVYTVPCMGSATLEEVAAAVPPGTPQWFQLYVWRDRGLTRELVQRAQSAGYRALVVTLDTPVSGSRERDIANGMNVPPKLTRAAAIDAARHPAWWMRFLAGPAAGAGERAAPHAERNRHDDDGVRRPAIRAAGDVGRPAARPRRLEGPGDRQGRAVGHRRRTRGRGRSDRGDRLQPRRSPARPGAEFVRGAARPSSRRSAIGRRS